MIKELSVKVKVYKPRPSSGLSEKMAKVYGEALEEIRLKYKREKTQPEDVLIEAKNPNHVLHNYFEWDNKKCGEIYRRQQANRLIWSIEVDVIEKDRVERKQCYINCTSIKNQIGVKSSGYIIHTDLMDNEDIRLQKINNLGVKILGMCRSFDNSDYEDIKNKISKLKKIANELIEFSYN